MLNRFTEIQNAFSYFLLLLVIPTTLYGQELFSPPEDPLSTMATYTRQSPDIDGKLTEPAWKITTKLIDFIQVEPNQGEPSEVYTAVRILYTDQALYIGVYNAEPLGVDALRAPDLKRDFAWRQHDTFAIAIDGFRDMRTSITFATNPYGAQKDYLSIDDTFFDGAWNGLWKVRTSRADSGWVAEFEIPFKTLRYPDKENTSQTWGINFLRLRRVSNEISAWSPYPRSFGFNRMEYAGVLKNMDVPNASSNILVNPYVLTNNDDMTVMDFESLRQTNFKTGGDIKWVVTPNTVVDVTINTDFAQAEADVQIANVGRFNIFFPEKRPFFLENASLFGAGLTSIGNGIGEKMVILPFFSRRIGLDPTGNPIPIDAGVRAVHRSPNKNAGIFYMHQRKSDLVPDKHVAVGRFSRNIGKQNRMGALATMSATGQDKNYLNWLGAVDGFFRFGDAHTLSTMVIQSGYTDDRPSGLGGFLQYKYTTNSLKAWWTQSFITETFNPELSFVSRENIIATSIGTFTNFRNSWIPFDHFIRSYSPGLELAWYHQLSTGILSEREIKFFPFWINLENGGMVRYSAGLNHQNLISEFNPLGVHINQGVYNYIRHSLTAMSDPSRIVSFSFQHGFGDFFDGSLARSDIALTAAPLPQINFQFKLNRNNFKNVGSDKSDATINLYTLQTDLALNPRLQLSGLYQRNSENKSDAFNIRIVWEYNPLSYIYFVFNSRQFLKEENLVQQEANAIIKMTYLKQF